MAENETNETPGELRKRYEAQIGKTKAVTEVAADLLRERYPLIKPEDLTDKDPSEWDEVAGKIQTERQQEQDQMLRQALEARGMESDEVERILTSQGEAQAGGDDNAGESAGDAWSSFGVRDSGGKPPGRRTLIERLEEEKIHGADALGAIFSEKPGKRL